MEKLGIFAAPLDGRDDRGGEGDAIPFPYEITKVALRYYPEIDFFSPFRASTTRLTPVSTSLPN